MNTLAFERQGPSIIVATRTGGQGKTLLSQLIHYLFDLAERPLRILAADTVEEGGVTETKSKLARFLEPSQTVEELGIGASIRAIRTDPNATVAYWSPLGLALQDGGVLVDVGANVLPTIWDWARETSAGRVLEEAPPIWLVIPVTAQKQSLLDALDLVRLARERQEDLPIARYFVALNEAHGKFDGLRETPEFQELADLQRAKVVEIISVGKCQSSIWPKVEAGFISLREMAGMQFKDYSKRFGVDSFVASAAERDFSKWLSATLDELAGVGFTPSEGATAKLA